MRREDRKRAVLRLLREKPTVDMATICESIKLSEVTARRLLLEMEREKLLRRTWGGAARLEPFPEEGIPMAVGVWGDDARRAIACTAYEMIDDHDVLFLDGGAILVELAGRIAAGHKRQVMICTHAMDIARAFSKAEDIQVVMVGGEFQHRSLRCTGGFAREMLQSFSFDKGFVEGNCFSIERGFTAQSLAEAEILRTALSVSKASIVLTDFSNFGVDAMSLIAPCASVSAMITDWHVPHETLHRFSAVGVRVFRAEQNEIR